MHTLNIKDIIVLLLITVNIYSCKSAYDVPQAGPPGSRNYIWTADTLSPEGSFMFTNIWGSSPKNIWLVGTGTTEDVCLWHYNGNLWKSLNYLPSSNLNALSGVDSDFVWAGDIEGNLFKYDGSNWALNQKIITTGFDLRESIGLYFVSRSEGYCVGQNIKKETNYYEAYILKYNGSKWFPLDIGTNKCVFTSIKKHVKSGFFLISATEADSAHQEKLFLFDSYNNKLHEIYSGKEPPVLCEINNELYITMDSKIYKLGKNGQLELWKSFKWSTPYLTQANGMSESDFFGIGALGLMHYNGTDFVTIYKTNLMLFNMLVFSDAIFVCAVDPVTYKTVIIKGVKKQEGK